MVILIVFFRWASMKLTPKIKTDETNRALKKVSLGTKETAKLDDITKKVLRAKIENNSPALYFFTSWLNLRDHSKYPYEMRAIKHVTPVSNSEFKLILYTPAKSGMATITTRILLQVRATLYKGIVSFLVSTTKNTLLTRRII